MTGGEFSVLFGAVFLLASALLCVVYGIVAGAREAVLSRKEKEQECDRPCVCRTPESEGAVQQAGSAGHQYEENLHRAQHTCVLQ